MNEYIEREAALEICETEYQSRLQMLDYCGDTVALNIGSEIKALPVADVAPVVHGRWKSYGVLLECQNCGGIYLMLGCNAETSWSYCPNCGAKMD
jgi:hypothetical protein